eukprot:jgi/Undpi1/8152/HiC_scaffold_24.g10622.m1
MSTTLRETGLFTSRKRRTGEIDGGPNHGVKRSFSTDKSRFAKDVSGGSSTASGSGGSGITAGVSKPAINNGHVQHAIHKEVQYSTEGKAQVAENTLKVFKFVSKSFVIPSDFEKDHKFGPLSGVSHEVRVVSAYMAGLLEARPGAATGVKMCIECGNKGHFPRYCSSAFDK